MNSTADVVDAAPGDGACSTGNTVGDGMTSECTLRAAVQEANALAGADTITVPAGTYTLTLAPREGASAPDASVGDLDLTESVVVTGADDATTIVRAAPTPYDGIDRVFENWNGGTISTLRDLTVANGDPGGGFWVDLGGGVRNNGPAELTLERVTVTGNEAYCTGGGVFNWNRENTPDAANGGSLQVVASTISTNRAVGSCGNGHAGALRSEGAGSDVTITDSVIEGNTAGTGTGGVGVSGSGGTIARTTFRNNSAGESVGALFTDTILSITGSRFEGNSAAVDAGAALFVGNGPVSITDTEIVDNTAGRTGGAILNRTTLAISRSLVAGNTGEQGGALANVDSGNVTIDRSTISANRATTGYGGGIDMCCNAATMSIANSTFSGNSAALGGGGISVFGPTVNLTNVTVTGSSASEGGAGINGGSTWNLLNTVVANSTGRPDCAAAGVATSHSLIEDPTNCGITDGGGNLLGVDPQLLPLADNGGDSPTHALASASPAVDAGSNAGCPATDQRGVARPVDGPDADATATCDMGAVELAMHRLTVEKTGSGSGTVSGEGAAVDCGTTCDVAVPESTSVTLTAAASPTSNFTGWSGACSGMGTCTVTMDAAKNVIATFELAQRALTVSKTGAGTVASSPDGIDCGGDCSETYPHGTAVTLTATPAAGSTFVGWSGACTGAGTCAVTMDAAKAATANFTPIPGARRRLTVDKTGGGEGRVASSPAGIDCGTDCAHDYDDGVTVTLTATPSGNSTFGSWSGCDRVTGDQCVVTMNVATTVTARFVAPRTLTVDRQGSGSGSVSSAPGGIVCGPDCTAAYAHGTEVVLTATPADGSTFGSWTGCDDVSDDECTISLGSDSTVTARFDAARVVHGRRVTLFLGRHLTAHGRVRTGQGPAACVVGVPVRIQRQTSNGWVTIARRVTADDGTFRTTVEDRADTYRVRAPATKAGDGPDGCANALSRTVEHVHD